MLIALLLAATTMAASAQVVSIAFQGQDGAPVASGDDGGTAFFPGQLGDWNVLNVVPPGSPSTADSGTPVLDGNGNATTLVFVLNPDAAGSYAFYDTQAPDNLCRNVVYLGSSSAGIGWQISGLTPNASYDLAFYGQSEVISGTPAFDNPGVWTIGTRTLANWDGTNMLAGVVFGNPDGTKGTNSIVADQSGKISGTFSFYGGPGGVYTGATRYSSWSGLQVIRAVDVVQPFAATPTVSPTNAVFAGTTVTLTAKTGGTPPLSYQWQLDTGAGAVNIPGATNLSYTVAPTTAQQGTYYLVVKSPYGSGTSPGTVLTVFPASAPILVADTAPDGAQTLLGGLVTFQASYAGTLPITYQWQVDRGQGFSNLPGATNNPLTLMNLQPTNAGAYRLTAANAIGQGQTSTAATLTVTTNASLAVFTGPNPGEGLDLDGNFVIAEYYGGTDIGPMQLGDAVFTFNNRPTGTPFTGPKAPSFGDTPADLNLAKICNTVSYGSALVFEIDNLQAGVNYKVQLLFHEAYFSTAGSRVMDIQINSVDLLTNLDLAAMGAYGAQPAGVVLSYTFTSDGNPLTFYLPAVVNNTSINGLTLEDLTHKAPPVVVAPPQDQAIYAGNAAQFAPMVSGSSPKFYQWQAGANGVFTNLTDGARVSGATNAVLTITAASLLDGGGYRVVISNSVGVVTSSPPATLTVFPRLVHQLIDIGVAANYKGAAVLGQLPDVWNIVGGGAASASALRDVIGTPTGVGVSIQGTSGGGNFGDGGLPTSPQTAGLLGYYDYVSGGFITVTLTNLDPASTYDLVVFSAGNQPGQSAVLSGAINGTNTLSTRNSFIAGDNYAQNLNARPDSTGKLVFQITNDPSQTPYGTFNGLQLQNNQATVILSIQRSGGSVVLTWPSGKLLQATQAAGPYQPVSGNPSSPYTMAPTGTQQYYRVQVSP